MECQPGFECFDHLKSPPLTWKKKRPEVPQGFSGKFCCLDVDVVPCSGQTGQLLTAEQALNGTLFEHLCCLGNWAHRLMLLPTGNRAQWWFENSYLKKKPHWGMFFCWNYLRCWFDILISRSFLVGVPLELILVLSPAGVLCLCSIFDRSIFCWLERTRESRTGQEADQQTAGIPHRHQISLVCSQLYLLLRVGHHGIKQQEAKKINMGVAKK